MANVQRKVPVESTTSPREIIAREIIHGIYDGRYAPGQRLVEADLSVEYQVSRGPIREAFNRLAAEGIVSLTLQRGAQIRRLSTREAINVLVVVEMLTGLAARLAAERIKSPGATTRLRQVLANLLQFDPLASSADQSRTRDSLYSTLIEIGDNADLRRAMPSVQVQLIRVQHRDAMRDLDRTRNDDYRRIVGMVLAGRPRESEVAARRHIAKAIASLRRFEAIRSQTL